MTVLSKLNTIPDSASHNLMATILGREWSFPYNCYEVGHGWTPFCTEAAMDVGLSAAKSALPLYTSLYLFTQLCVQRKYDPAAFAETIKSIFSSTSFLSFNVLSGCAISCILRNSTDRYYYRVQCYFPAMIASYLALMIERPGRRPALAFYMANLSSELIYKWAVHRGVLSPIKNGETLLFAAGMACYFHFVRVNGFGHDPVSIALKYLIGPLEAKSRSTKNKTILAHNCNESFQQALSQDKILVQQRIPKNNKLFGSSFINKYNNFHNGLTKLLNLYFQKHQACPHANQSCVDYSLSPLLSRYTLGYVIKSSMNLAGQLHIITKNPLLAFKKAFSAKSSHNFGLFLASLVCISRSSHCLLRRFNDRQENWHSLVAGGFAGLSMWFSPKSTLSTYVIWKCIEQYFFLAVKNGKITHQNEFIGLLYATSVNILLYVFALEPRFIRPSYMKFIDSLSEHRLHQLNRMVLDIFGTGASIGYEDFFPDLDPKYMSNEFKELIFNWLIQPYD